MATHSYPVEVQTDFLEKITRARPVQALAEFIWNALDADATKVEVFIEDNDLGATSRIIVRDNGVGMERRKAPDLFRRLGGSWKRPGAKTGEGRSLHGQDGRGRFKVFSLGKAAAWEVVYRDQNRLLSYSVEMSGDRIREVFISDEIDAEDAASTGVTLTISEIEKDFPSLSGEAVSQEFAEIFALYLAAYKHVSIIVGGVRIDPSGFIASKDINRLQDIVDDGKAFPVELEVIEWRDTANRSLYLCNDNGFPLLKVERRFQIGPFQFSAYLKSPYVARMQAEGTLELAEMNPHVLAAIDKAQEHIRAYFRERAAAEAQTVVEEWKHAQVYPFDGDAKTRVEEVERQVFDIVAVNVAQYMPDFETTPKKNKALHLRLLRQAIEKSPEELQMILGEVLKLPKKKQEQLADLLKDVSLSAIISAAKIVADRLRFLAGLEAILFDSESKKRLKERSQLHRLLAQNCWLFGEEYNLSVDDRSLTEVLRKHKSMIGDDTVIDEPVTHVSKERGIVDLVLSRAIRRHRADEINHLVVELKAPRVKVGRDEITQIEEYAMSMKRDERFRGVKTNWSFWVVSDDYGDYAEYRMKDADGNGRIYNADNVSIWVKTWAQVLEENRARMQFFKEHLEYEADRGASLSHLREHYSEFLKGVLVDRDDTDSPAMEAEEKAGS